jgi:Cation transporter/ATPase, N-terminus
MTIEAKIRLGKYGSNDLTESDDVQLIKIVLAQVANAMTIVNSF